MIRRVLAAASVSFLVGLVAVGCDGGGFEDDCNTVCVATNKCSGATQVNCATTCAAKAAIASDGGCDESFTAANDCRIGAKDVCNLAGACDSQDDTALGCLSTYCGANADDANCKTLADS
jgi:hypothetical protein